ncbi:hypothetical protein JCM19240_3981 [Vibrio maritimus]|uniref:Uncharacterized protein n=1 Tax=Vibrio maritimus TaxID=990268 RepID=A0A090TEC5_9VIBR|nr:hypothetical protein JCM19240_3981 [Vibrio maritimus]
MKLINRQDGASVMLVRQDVNLFLLADNNAYLVVHPANLTLGQNTTIEAFDQNSNYLEVWLRNEDSSTAYKVVVPGWWHLRTVGVDSWEEIDLTPPQP